MESKVARNALHCDGKDCQRPSHRIAKGEKFVVDGSGYLYCPQCAEAPVVEPVMKAGSLA